MTDEEMPETPTRPSAISRKLTEVSKKYDRQGKGYLDETERALRLLDSNNRGFLDVDKVYIIMESLQQEQKKSAALMDAIQTEQKKSMNLKKGVIALCCFSVLLALANIGTSFAAATLAKDTSTDSSNDLVVVANGERVATTSKIVELEISMTPIDANRRRRSRRLQAAESFVCEGVPTGANCTLQGEINQADAEKLYKQFCPQWPQYSICWGGVPQVTLNCNNKITDIFGGSNLPSTGPMPYNDPVLNIDYIVYPTIDQGYAALQMLNPGLGWPNCPQNFDFGIYCPMDGSACLAFAAYLPSCVGNVEVKLCNDPPPPPVMVTPASATSTITNPGSQSNVNINIIPAGGRPSN